RPLQWSHPCPVPLAQSGSYQASETQLKPCSIDHRPGNHLSLVETTFFKPGWMQRHRDDQFAIVSRCKFFARCSEPRVKTTCKLPMALEPADRLAKGTVIRPARFCRLEREGTAPSTDFARHRNLQLGSAFRAKVRS